MKQRLCLILMVSILFQMFCFFPVSAEENTQIQISEELQLLKLLNIFEADEDTRYDAGVSRADFAIYLGKMLGYDEYEVNNQRYYIDIPMDHWALNCINKLAEIGIFSVGKEKKFRPDDQVTVDEAVCAFVKALGYGSVSQSMGGWTDGIQKIAGSTDLMKGVNSTNPLTLQNLLKMMFNALHENVIEIDIDNGKVNYSVNEDETLMSWVFDLYCTNGTITAAEGINLLGTSNKNTNTAAVDNVLYKCSVDAIQFLGDYVKVYYQGKQGDNEIVLIVQHDHKNNTIELNLRDFLGFDKKSYQIEYYKENGKAVKKQLPKSVRIIRNGIDTNTDINGVFEQVNKGTVKLISMDGDDSYEIILLNDYYNMQVGYVNVQDEMVYSKDNSDVLDVRQDKKVTIIGDNGENSTLSDIKAGDVLSVFESDWFLTIYISRRRITGNIQNFDDEDRIIITVDGEKYDVDKVLYAKKKQSFSGSAITEISFCFDWFGMIAAIAEEDSSQMLFGYIIRFAYDEDLDENLMLKLFTQEGNVEMLHCCEKVNIDGKTYKKSSATESALENGKPGIVGQLIRYSLNGEHQVKRIDTSYFNAASENKHNSLTKPVSGGHYFSGAKMFSNNILIGSDIIIMRVPTNPETADNTDFQITGLNSFSTDNGYTVEGYRTDAESPYTTVLLHKTNDESLSDVISMILVDSVTVEVNDKDEIVNVLRGFVGSSTVEYEVGEKCRFYNNVKRDSNGVEVISEMTNATVNSIKRGDIVRVSKNYEGKIGKIIRFYDSDSGQNPPVWGDYTYKWNYNFLRVSQGVAQYVREGVLCIEHEKYSELVVLPANGISVYDPNKRYAAYAGNIGDVIEAANQGYRVYVGRRSGAVTSVIVIKQ